jgi:hypothetical protein
MDEGVGMTSVEAVAGVVTQCSMVAPTHITTTGRTTHHISRRRISIANRINLSQDTVGTILAIDRHQTTAEQHIILRLAEDPRVEADLQIHNTILTDLVEAAMDQLVEAFEETMADMGVTRAMEQEQ